MSQKSQYENELKYKDLDLYEHDRASALLSNTNFRIQRLQGTLNSGDVFSQHPEPDDDEDYSDIPELENVYE